MFFSGEFRCPINVLIHKRKQKMSNEGMNKEKWLGLFQEIGLNEKTMSQWHHEFESRYPNEHQSFLEWLSISADEIKSIRSS